MTADTIISLLAGGNILELVLGVLFIGYERQKRKADANKMEAEAAGASVDTKQKSIDLQQDQYDYLLQKLTDYQKEYFALGDKLKEANNKHAEEINETTRKFLTVINDKCNEIAELKSKIIYFKGLRCYKSDCSLRIKTNPKDIKDEAEGTQK